MPSSLADPKVLFAKEMKLSFSVAKTAAKKRQVVHAQAIETEDQKGLGIRD